MTVPRARAAPTTPGRGGEEEALEAAAALPELFKTREPGQLGWRRRIPAPSVAACPAGSPAARSRDAPMRPPTMSGHFLLAPIPESSSDYLLPKDIKLAVLGAGRVGKSGEWGKGARRPTTAGVPPPPRRDAGRPPPVFSGSLLLSSGPGWRLLRVAPVSSVTFRGEATLSRGPGGTRAVPVRATTLTYFFS